MLRQRGFDPALTWIARAEGKIVGFWIMGSNGQNSQAIAYTVATGTIPSHRGHGLAGQIFERMLANHRLRGLESIELEVIKENTSARKAYGKLGFEPERDVTCFTLPASPEKPTVSIPPMPLEIIESAGPELWDWPPTWQNSLDALKRIEKDIEIKGIYDGDVLLGYGAVIRPTAKLAQLAVRPDCRRKGLGSRILAALIAGAGSGGLQVINAYARDDGFAAFMEKNGGQAGTRQTVLSRRL